MNTLKKQIRHVGNTTLSYTILYNGSAYDFEVKSVGEHEGYILVEDVARSLREVEEVAELFASNLVFPQNVLEVFDDLLGSGEDFTKSY